MFNKIVPTEPARFEPGLPGIGEAILSQQFTATPAVKQVNKFKVSEATRESQPTTFVLEVLCLAMKDLFSSSDELLQPR